MDAIDKQIKALRELQSKIAFLEGKVLGYEAFAAILRHEVPPGTSVQEFLGVRTCVKGDWPGGAQVDVKITEEECSIFLKILARNAEETKAELAKLRALI